MSDAQISSDDTASPVEATGDIPDTAPPAAYVLAVVLGVLGSLAAAVFLELMVFLQEGFISRIPDALGWDTPPAWYVMAGLVVSVIIILLARRMPGATGKGPLTGFHFDNPPRVAASILLAALATLTFGASLGPEGPLIVVGTTLAGLLVRKAPANVATLAMFLGGIAAIGSIFGNPFVTAFLLLEFVAMGAAPRMILLPALVALGAGYVTQVGWGSMTGLGVVSLSMPGLPAYDSVDPGDLLMGVGVALVVAVAAALARGLGVRVEEAAAKKPAGVLVAAGVVTGIVAIVVVTAFDVNYDQILFSGETGMPALITETSIATVLAIVIGKLIVYGIALGGGFRGGPIFPATFVGLGFGVLAALIFDMGALSPMAAVGIAAAATVMTRLPFTSGIIAMLLVGSSGLAIAPFAILGAVGGVAVTTIIDKRREIP